IVVTLFGTAVSLGLGAVQIGQGVEIVSGVGKVGNAFIIGVIAVLTVAFIISAVSGVKRGIRLLSNTNMLVAGFLAIFVFVAGPTMFILNFLPAAFLSFFKEFFMMLSRNANQWPVVSDFLSAWTTFYWSWWFSWTLSLDMFIANISRVRIFLEFV